MRTDYETIELTRHDDHILLVRLNRPDVRNAMNTLMGQELLALWSAFYVDQADIRAIVLTGAGDKAFCAGGDLKERNGMTDAQWQSQHALYEQMTRAMQECPLPVVGAINGAAFGGGCEMTLNTDFAYASPNARFALTEITLGIMPGTCGTQNLPRAVGQRRAMEIILTGKPFSAEQALEWGMLNAIYDSADLLDAALDTARTIANNAPIAVRQAKKSIVMSGDMDRRNGYAFEIEAYNRMVSTEDRLEGVKAFNEKRKPNFKGR
jgi:enoyl-CoA hydratase